jgi:iron-sulfur cluster assembly protein
MDSPVQISIRAAEEVKKILEQKGIPDSHSLRVGVRGAGCGVAFKLGFDVEKDDDEVYEIMGIKLLIKKKEMMFLIGKQVDFYDEQDGRGFFFTESSPSD